tara:strand:+ start:219 stop:566 length:348 start_codon:yes stop_codon:yes gene_type:complete
MKLFILINIISIACTFKLYVNPVFIYYKNRFTILSCVKKEENNNSEEIYKKLLIDLDKIKREQVEQEKNKREIQKGLNLTEIRNYVNNSSKSKFDDLDNLDYLDNHDENPFWYEY